MRTLRLSSLALAAALSLSMTACGGDDEKDSTTPVEKPDFAAGSTMAKLSEAGKLRVGTKFDQPLFGQKGLSGDPHPAARQASSARRRARTNPAGCGPAAQ